MKKAMSVLGLASVLGLGCGGDGGAMKGTANPTAARQSVTQAVALRTAVDMKDGAQVAAAAMQLNTASLGIVMPTAPQALTEEPTLANAETGTQTCDDQGCKFTGFGQGGMVIDGTVTSAAAADGARKVVWDLKMTSGAVPGAPQLQSFSWSAKGDIVVSATNLDGWVKTTAKITTDAQGMKLTVDQTSDVKYNAVALGATGPTGGNVYAKMKVSSSQGGDTAYEATHEFK